MEGTDLQAQIGVLLGAGGRKEASEVLVAQPPPDHNKIDPTSFMEVLPGADPQHLLLADAPFSGLVGDPVLLVYDASSQGEANPRATRLTTGLQDGLEVQVRGDAVAFYTRPGLDFTADKWAELDNCISLELAALYQRGQRPSEEELAQIVLDFHAGRFNYGRQEGEEDEDGNKDDGGIELEDAMEGRGVPAGMATGGAGAAGMPRPPSGVDWRPLVGEGHPGPV